MLALRRSPFAPSAVAVHAVAALAIAASACAPSGPSPIAYGAAECAECRMQVDDRRFGAQLVSDKGKTYVFDSVECLATYWHGHDGAAARGAWVTDFTRPGTLVRVDSAAFFRVAGSVSPMGRGYVAVAAGARPPATLTVTAGPLRWSDVVTETGRVGLAIGAGHAH